MISTYRSRLKKGEEGWEGRGTGDGHGKTTSTAADVPPFISGQGFGHADGHRERSGDLWGETPGR